MARILIRFIGFDGVMDLMQDRIVISRKGIFAALKFGFNAHREIPIGQISEVNYRPPLLLGMGTIDFIRTGRPTQDTKKSDTAVRFKKTQIQDVERFKEKVFSLMSQQPKDR